MDAGGKKGLAVGGGGGWREAGACCHPAVSCLKAFSGVNLLTELESSAGCHLFSTLGMLPLPVSAAPAPPLTE